MKHRLERINELIRRELGTLLFREVVFKAKLVTIQEASISPDLKNAYIYLSIIGTPEEGKEALERLEEARPTLQHQLSKRVILKYTPHLHFKIDTGITRGDRVLNIMSALNIPEDDPAGDQEEQD